MYKVTKNDDANFQPAPSVLTTLLSPLLLPILSLLSSSGFARIALPVCAGAHTQSARIPGKEAKRQRGKEAKWQRGKQGKEAKIKEAKRQRGKDQRGKEAKIKEV